MVLRALMYFPWKNAHAQIAFYVTVKYWMPQSKILAKLNPSKTGFSIVLIGLEVNWRTESVQFEQEAIPDLTEPEVKIENDQD